MRAYGGILFDCIKEMILTSIFPKFHFVILVIIHTSLNNFQDKCHGGNTDYLKS